MKIGIKCFIALVIVAMTSLCVSATDTTTKFKTGPFTVSVDLGMPCNDIEIMKPEPGETISGLNYTSYGVRICDVFIGLTKFDKDIFDTTGGADLTSRITSSLLSYGAIEGTISVYDRKIDSKSGAVGSGYISKYNSPEYITEFYISPKSVCGIYVPDKETKFISIIKTINVTEVA